MDREINRICSCIHNFLASENEEWLRSHAMVFFPNFNIVARVHICERKLRRVENLLRDKGRASRRVPVKFCHENLVSDVAGYTNTRSLPLISSIRRWWSVEFMLPINLDSIISHSIAICSNPRGRDSRTSTLSAVRPSSTRRRWLIITIIKFADGAAGIS